MTEGHAAVLEKDFTPPKEHETEFSHVKPGDTEFKGSGLRDFFLYRDLGIAKATNGKVIAHLVKANHGADRPAPAGTSTSPISRSSS